MTSVTVSRFIAVASRTADAVAGRWSVPHASKQMPKKCDLREVAEHQADRQRPSEPRRLALGEQPIAENENRQRHQRPCRQSDADDVADEGADGRVEVFEMRVEEPKLQHD